MYTGYSGQFCEIELTTTTSTRPTTTTSTTTTMPTTTTPTTTLPATATPTTTTQPITTTTTPSTTTTTTVTTSTTTPTTTTPTTTTTTPTTTSTTPSTTTLKPCSPVSNCTTHYRCDTNGNRKCVDGWTGSNCNIQIPGGVADCAVYDCKCVCCSDKFYVVMIIEPT